MHATGLKCIHCGSVVGLGEVYSCKKCGGILQVEYDYAVGSHFPVADRSQYGFWRYAELLSVAPNYAVTLGEGDTPFLRAEQLGQRLGLSTLFIKNEGCNPTGSFKDRPVAVGIAKAREFRANTVVVASSGNAGASVAAYAAKAGLRAIVIIPAKTPLNKVNQALAYGATVVKVEGPYSNSFHLAKAAAERYGWANLTTTFINPYTVEGNKTVSYEIFEALKRKVPDWIVIPVGAGPLLVGIYRGMLDLCKMGLISRIPRLAAVQAERCAPIAQAYQEGKEEVEPWKEEPDTVASGIADPLDGYSADGSLTLQYVRESRGTVVTLTEEEIMKSVDILAKSEGVYAEPTGAVSVMAIRKLISQGIITSDQVVVALVTGNGLKCPSVPSGTARPVVVERVEDLDHLAIPHRCSLR